MIQNSNTMKLPCRKFLHLAAGAAALYIFLLGISASSAWAQDRAFQFGLIGDMPYTTVQQQNTGIAPSHRGLGLAKWAKAAMLERIRHERPQVQRVLTGNAYSNEPMLAINNALGFKLISTRTEWRADVAALRRNHATAGALQQFRADLQAHIERFETSPPIGLAITVTKRRPAGDPALCSQGKGSACRSGSPWLSRSSSSPSL